MSNFWYPKWKEARLQNVAGAALDGSVRVALIDLGAYTVGAEDTFYSDIPPGAVVAVSTPLLGKTYALGIFDADDVTFPSVAGASCEGLVLFVDSGDPATSRLALYLDAVPGLPITPDGTDIVIRWNAAGVAAL